MSLNTVPSPVVNAQSLDQCKRAPELQLADSDYIVQNERTPDISTPYKRARTSTQTIANSTIDMPSNQVMNSTTPASKFIVHLAVTKVAPSYTEPWRKMPPDSLEGAGFLFDFDGNNTLSQAEGSPVNTRKNLRVLTTASVAHHATSIRASISSNPSPLSITCSVEWVSLPMNLSILKLETNDTDWFARAQDSCAFISERLPEMGEHLSIGGFSSLSSLSDPDGARSTHRPNAFNSTGLVSHYFADEDHHFMLRMHVSTSANICNGGVVFDKSGCIVGLLGSEPPVAIPNVALHQFIEQCREAKTAVTKIVADTISAVASETDNESCHKMACQRSLSDATASQSDKEKSSATSHLIGSSKGYKNSLPGIASLGITGYQRLENKSLRKSFGTDVDGVDGVRINGAFHTVHSTANSSIDHDQTHCNGVVGHCHSSTLRNDDVLLSINNEPIMLNGTVKLCPGRENERIDFRWLVSKHKPGSQVQLEVIRQKKKIQLAAILSEPKHLVPRLDEDRIDELPSYVIAGGCVFVPLSHAWIEESRQSNPNLPLQGYHRYLLEQRKGDQQLIILSHVLADDVNMGYHGMRNLLVTSVNGQRLTNMQHLVDVLVKSKQNATLEFRCSDIHAGRSKLVISMDSAEAMNSESSILSRHMIDAWCSPNALSAALKRDSQRKAHRHGVTCGLKTLRDLRNAVSETTLVVQTLKTADERVISNTKRILHLSEAHKMQSAPNFSGKYIEDVGWTQVKTKHLSQLCVCGKTTRFYCICSVGVMRCKDCFLKHCRDHMSNGEEGCDVCGDKTELLAEGIDLVTSKKRKASNPNQALQSRCAVCKAKTCLCCSACGDEPEVPLCDVTTGRNCMAIHISERHSCTHKHNADAETGNIVH